MEKAPTAKRGRPEFVFGFDVEHRRAWRQATGTSHRELCSKTEASDGGAVGCPVASWPDGQ
eukprot:8518999-Alexandrium_andersonii.AAC.1